PAVVTLPRVWVTRLSVVLVVASVLAGCGSSPPPPAPAAPASGSVSPSVPPTAGPTHPPLPNYGNPDGHPTVPAEAQAEDTSHPTTVIGNGKPDSCTSAAVVAAVLAGGIITFSCGPAPVTITMSATAKVHNDKPKVVIDGGGLVTLSGGGTRRILYQN